MNPQEYLFLLTIGPVQSFIAQARKTHDLYAGSRMLSALCKAGIEEAPKQLGTNCIIISPDAHAGSIPNRFWAKFSTTDNEEQLTNKGQAIEEAVRATWRGFAENALGKDLNIPIGSEAQINAQLDIQWLFVSIKNEDYNQAFEDLTNQLAAIKNLREFGQMPEKGRKCIVDGERNVKFYRKTRDEWADFIEKKLFQTYNDVTVLEHDDDKTLSFKHLQPGEGLSAVSFTKRKYLSQHEEFASTAGIALFDLLYGKVKDKDKKLWEDDAMKDYRDLFKDHFDEQLLFEDNLTVKYFDKHGLFPKLVKGKNEEEAKAILSPKVKRATELLQSIKAKVEKDYDDKPFTKYYALIQFDGDRMGKWLSGDPAFLKAGSSGKLKLEQFHKDFTTAVTTFAETVEKRLQAPEGKTVFAGGEDFLGFINLHHLFTVMLWLQEEFAEKVDAELRKNTTDYAIVGDAVLTMSAGVVIAHYKEPLSEVLKAATEVEKQAKDNGRNGFVVRAIRHAGGDTTCQMPWLLPNGENSAHVLSLVMKDLEGDFSGNFIAQTVRTLQAMAFEPPNSLIEKEMKRTVARSYKKEREVGQTPKEYADQKAQAIANLLQNLNQLMAQIMLDRKGDKKPLITKEKYENLASLLSLFDFLTRKTR